MGSDKKDKNGQLIHFPVVFKLKEINLPYCNLEEQGFFPSSFPQMVVFAVPLVEFYKNDKTNSLFDSP